MANNKRKAAQAKRKTIETPTDQGRRNALKWLRNGAIAAPFVAGAGIFSVRSVQATICEADLSKIGQGIPAVVQIHDPTCPMCNALQKQTRRALRPYGADQFRYLVANIQTLEGGAMAARYGVPHVTLLFFDGDGQMVDMFQGPTQMPALRAKITEHLGNPT